MSLLHRVGESHAICVTKEGIFWPLSGANGNFWNFIIFFVISACFFQIYSEFFPLCSLRQVGAAAAALNRCTVPRCVANFIVPSLFLEAGGCRGRDAESLHRAVLR